MPRELSEFFRQYSNKIGKSDEIDKRTQLLAVKDRLLYAWTNDGLRAAAGLKNSTTDGSGHRNCSFEFEVKFVLTKKPDGIVEWIELNRSGSCLAICTNRRVYVVFLPKQLWLLRSLNELEKQYSCRCVSVDDGIGKKNKKLRLLRIRWHPGSPTDRHLVTLWSDDVLRITNVGQPTESLIQIPLDSSSNSASFSKDRPIKSSLGESAVSFDFGAPIDSENASGTELWPVFVLCGNGDVFSVVTDIKGKRQFSPMGPLVISPETDTNYGADACDIAFLPGKLPILVIATSFGMLYHALVVRNETPSFGSGFSFELHVYESAEIEFTLSTLDLTSTEVKEDNETSNVVIMKDSTISRRYYARHRTGLHTVDLTWAHTLEEENQPDLADVESNVEYVLCTAPKLSATSDRSENSPVGFALVSCLATESIAVVLLSDFSIYCLPVSYDALSGLISTSKTDDSASKKVISRDYFIDTIKRILQKSATVPVLRARSDKEISEEEAAEVMYRCMEVLRKEYMQRLLNAREACAKRVAELSEIFDQQNQDLTRLEQQIDNVRTQSQKSARRKKQLAETQAALSERLERATDAMSGGETGELSAQEENMVKELEDAKDTVESTLDEVALLKEKMGSLAMGFRDDRENALTPIRINELNIKKRLEEQQHQIETLMRAVNAMRNEIRLHP